MSESALPLKPRRTTPRVVLITGAAGQDGLYLCRALAAAGHRVIGCVRPASPDAALVAIYAPTVEVVPLDVTDRAASERIVTDVRPDVIVNLAAQSSVGASWQHPEETMHVNAVAVEHWVSLAKRLFTQGHDCHFVQASSSEEFEGTSPYAQSKRRAREAVLQARDRGLPASVLTLYNHESPLRPERFVTRKITRGVAAIARGVESTLTLGDLSVRRDWGFAGDYAHAIAMLVNDGVADDVVLATGVAHSLSDLVTAAFAAVGIDEPARYVVSDPSLVRPADVPEMVGDPSLALEVLGWTPSLDVTGLVRHMVGVDIRRLTTGVEHHPDYLYPQSIAS